MALAFLLGQLAIFSELGREVRVGFLLVGIARVGVSSGVRSTGVAGVVFIVVLLFLFLLELEAVVLLVVVPLPLSLECSGFGVVRVSLATLEQCSQ